MNRATGHTRWAIAEGGISAERSHLADGQYQLPH
jgi:hypothetical protein